MKTDWTELEPFRLTDGTLGSGTGNTFGFFVFQFRGKQIRAMAADGQETGWEHVSVSVMEKHGKKALFRIPSWEEMAWVKAQFWGDDECVIQFHPPASEYVNNHAGCLHLWKCVGESFPAPPSILVGIKEAGTIVEL
jgi:hypothetical protein